MNPKITWLGLGCSILLLVAVAEPAPANLIVNGDFEAGNIGFSTDYTFSPGALDIGETTYDVLNDPSTAHFAAASFGDHTTGSGLMMAVNGAVTAGLRVWSQSVTVQTNTTYDFSSFVASWFAASPAELLFQINGSPLGTLNAPATTGVWQEFTASWSSGASTSALIEIIDLNTAAGGNDFALDDLSLTAAPRIPMLPATAAIVMGLILVAVAAWWLGRTALRWT